MTENNIIPKDTWNYVCWLIRIGLYESSDIIFYSYNNCEWHSNNERKDGGK